MPDEIVPPSARHVRLVPETVTTVGHQDFELSVPGQRVSALIIIAGIAAFSYMLSQAGRILFEIAGVQEELALQAMRLAAHKMPVRTRVVARETEVI